LDRSFKVYIKTVVCTPEKTTKRMYDSFWRQFEHSEKVQFACALWDTGGGSVCHADTRSYPNSVWALAGDSGSVLTLGQFLRRCSTSQAEIIFRFLLNVC